MPSYAYPRPAASVATPLDDSATVAIDAYTDAATSLPMPYFERHRTNLHFEVYPCATPDAPWVALLPGLTATTRSFPWTVEFLQRSRNVVTFDPRGAGLTRPIEPGFTLADMADDLAALIDDLDTGPVDVIGVSMGGMVAQELWHAHPRRVRRLVLCCSMPGRTLRHRPSNRSIAKLVSALAILQSNRRSPRAARMLAELLFAPGTPEHVQRRFFSGRAPAPAPTLRGVILQLLASRSFESAEVLPRIDVPTLVAVGRNDALTPPVNSHILADRIPGAELAEFDGGHLFFYENQVPFFERLDAFLSSEPARSRPRAMTG